MPGSAGPQNALKYAYRLLSVRGRSQKELSARLRQKGFAPEEAGDVIARLLRLGYLDDRARALSLKQTALEGRLMGRAGAIEYLRRMGIGRQEAEDAVQDYDELQGALRLAEKKLKAMGGCPEDVKKRRLIGALRRKGHSVETIKRVLRINEKD